MPLSSAEKDKRKKRALERRNQRRDEILDAARKVFSKKGYHASSVNDILEKAKIARGTFYLYFPSKRAIFEELLGQMFTQITTAIRRIQVGDDANPVLDQLSGNVSRIIDVLESNRDLTIILLREAVGLDSDFDQKLAVFYRRLSERLEGAILLGQTMGLLRKCNVQLITRCVLGSVKEVILHLLTAEKKMEISREDLVREILEYSLRGIFLR